MRMNHRSDAPIILRGKIVEDVIEFIYLDSKTKPGSSGQGKHLLPQQHLEKQED